MNQMFASPRALAIAAAILLLMRSMPSMHHMAFLRLCLLCAGLAYFIYWRQHQPEAVAERQIEFIPNNTRAGETVSVSQTGSDAGAAAAQLPPAAESAELGWDDVQPVDVIGLEIGYRLIPMVHHTQGGDLLGRINDVRQKISQEISY